MLIDASRRKFLQSGGMGIGWLAREGKLVFRHERGGLKVAVQTARHN